MNSVELETSTGRQRIDLHDAITVIAIDAERRADVAASLTKALGSAAVVHRAAPPTAAPNGASAGDAALVEAEAAVATAEAAVMDARTALEAAERAYTSAQDALLDTAREVDRDAKDAVAAAEARLEVAQAGAAAARRALVQAREASERDEKERAARDDELRRQIAELQEEKAKLDAERSELVAQLGGLGAAPDPEPVEEALNGLRRLRQVKPRPSERAVALADKWVEVRERLALLPMPPAPPEWLVTPALVALNDAREALARAERDPGEQADPAKVDAVERAHREVLEAEQRVMRKGSRTNRRRLEQAEDAEREALNALGVTSYGDYLQRVAPDLEDGTTKEERIAQARAALADAEAVWEELHGGEASPEYTAAKQEEAELRNQAYAVLGDQTVEDADIDARLRAHVETVVDTEWAEHQLREALEAQGAEIGEGELDAIAEAWLASVPERRRSYEELDKKLGALDARLRDIDDTLATHKSDAFFGADTTATVEQRSPEERGAGTSPDDPFSELTVALEEAEAAEAEAQSALAAARARLDESDRAAATAAGKEREADEARDAVDAARARLEQAEAALSAAQQASRDAVSAAEEAARAAAAAKPTPAGGLAADAWLLARVLAARAADADAPVVVDASAVAAPGGLRVLERASSRGQVVVLGGDEAVTTWAKGLGDRAVIRSIEEKR